VSVFAYTCIIHRERVRIIHIYMRAHTQTHTNTHTTYRHIQAIAHTKYLFTQYATKETYYRGKRDLLRSCGIRKCQKRRTIEAKETYYRGKRDLLYRQQRPTIEAKETYCRGNHAHKVPVDKVSNKTNGAAHTLP
jgi:hypothetical protein